MRLEVKDEMMSLLYHLLSKNVYVSDYFLFRLGFIAALLPVSLCQTVFWRPFLE